MYLAGQCYLCGKMIWTKEKYERPDNVVCEILVCIDCHNQTMELLKKGAELLPKEEAQATPQPHPCKECNKYGCDVHCPYYGK